MKESTLRIRHGNVCVNDEFVIDTEAGTVCHHEHDPREHGDIIGAYVLATWGDQRLVIHVGKDEINAAKEKKPLVWRRYPHICTRKLVIDKMIAELKRIGVWT